jgi:hypothetical protein
MFKIEQVTRKTTMKNEIGFGGKGTIRTALLGVIFGVVGLLYAPTIVSQIISSIG